MSTPPPGYARALRPEEQALFDELPRAQVLAVGVQIEVGVISWPSSHQPSWTGCRWRGCPPPAVRQTATAPAAVC